MRVCDLPREKVVPGLRIRSETSERIATILAVEMEDDDRVRIQWDDEDEPFDGFYPSICPCVVIEFDPFEELLTIMRQADFRYMVWDSIYVLELTGFRAQPDSGAEPFSVREYIVGPTEARWGRLEAYLLEKNYPKFTVGPLVE